MGTQTSTQASPPAALRPDREGFLAGLCAGRFRWDVVHPFPRQDDADRRTGDAVLAELRHFLVTRVDPDQIEVSGGLPDELLDQLRSRGYLALRMDAKLGGLGLSFANAFRVIEAAMSWAVPVGWCLAIQNGLGAGAYLPLLPAGPLRHLIARRVAEGAVFSDADTEPSGASNERRSTTATLTADGSSYVIDGEKICIGNGPAADFLVVSATVNDADGERVEYFFLDTSSPGFSVRSAQEFMGLKGARIGALLFDHVRVPPENMLTLPEDVDTEFVVNRPARMYIVAAPALAIAKLCAHWSREFVNRRSIDGLPLGDYDEIQRIVAATLADAFAIESIVEWCLLGESREGPDDFRLEQSAAKNITSVACWRAVDRTMSLLAAEGLETARSKAARGAQPLPVERALRDARALRIAGGVDFLLDKFFGETVVLSRVRKTGGLGQTDGAMSAPDVLSPRNREHQRFVEAEISAFPEACRGLLRARPLPDRVPILVNRIANELLTVSVTLSRAATLAAEGQADVEELADVYCAAARHRIADWWRQASDDDEPDYGRVAVSWLGDGRPQLVLGDVLTQLPPAGVMGEGQ
jgi:alkylation response protein AidB-like acyl-CoA dehydrogenase